jgi:hypothetical protein
MIEPFRRVGHALFFGLFATPGLSTASKAERNNIGYKYQRDWYWEVISDRKIIRRGLAPTKAQAHVQARKVAASHAVRQPESLPFEGLKAIQAP